MTNRFLLALLGATTLVPATAMAQDIPRERVRERIERGVGQSPFARGEVNGEVRVRAPRAERPERQERPDRGDWQRSDQPRPDRGNWQRPEQPRSDQPRPDRGNWQRPDQPRPDRPRADRGDWQRPDGNPRRDPPRDAQGQIDREQLRGAWARERGVDRDRQREQWRRDDMRNRRDRDGGWSRSDNDWRDNDRYRGDRNDRRQWNDRAGWNRDWRADRRYDWNRYRSANRNLYRLPRYYAPQGWNYGYRRFGIGVTLNSFLFGQNYWINDPFSYRLPEAYGPYRWVRYYNDALLVDVRSGQVVDVEYDFFW